MADKTTKILEVVVDNNAAVTSIAELNRLIDEQKTRQQELSKAYKEGKISEGDYYKAMAQSKEAVKSMSREVQELSKEIQNNIKMDTEQKGSLRALRAELSNLTKEYDSLSEAERNSAQGMELQNKIQSLMGEIKGSEEQTGRFFRNVGNYANGVMEAFARAGVSIGGLQGPLKGATMGLQAMSSTPIIAILGALITIIQKVIQNLKSSEASMNAVTTALAPLNAAGRLFQVTMQKLGEGLAKIVTKMTEWADKLGLIKDAMKVEQQLVKDELALRQREREIIRQNADDQLAISQLKAKAAEKDKYTAQERIGFLEEAMEKEKAIAARERETAAERYRILVEQSKLAENSAEENDALAQSYAEMRQAEQAYFDKERELTAQIIEAKNQIKAENAAAFAASRKAAEQELKNQAIAAGLTEEQIEQKLSVRQREIEARLKLVEEGSQAEYELEKGALEAQYDIDMQKLAQEEGTQELMRLRREQFQADMLALEEDWTAQMNDLANELLEEQVAAIEATLAAEKAQAEEEKRLAAERLAAQETAANAISGLLGALGDAFAKAGEENKEMAKMAKIVALAQIAIETGVATAKGITQAMSVPFPGNLAAIATTIATILAGITSAVSTVKSAKLASGGLVSGPGTATSDSVPAMLSNGESVMNARSTAMFGPLLSTLNQAGGGVAFNPAASGREGFDFLAAAVESGMKHANISVAVDEVSRVNTRVTTIKERSKI